jgi:hypothetical protein
MLTLRPSHPLLPERSESIRSHLVRDDVHVMNGFLAAAVRSQCRVDIFCEHVAVHLQLADHIRPPPAVAATEEAELKHPATARMSDGIDFVELNGYHLGVEGFVGVVDDATALHDVWLFGKEALGCPADVVRVRAVIGVEDAGEVCWFPFEGEEVIKVIGFGSRVWNFDDCELLVVGCQLVQLCFDWLYGSRCVVNESLQATSLVERKHFGKHGATH